MLMLGLSCLRSGTDVECSNPHPVTEVCEWYLHPLEAKQLWVTAGQNLISQGNMGLPSVIVSPGFLSARDKNLSESQ